jgi:ATP-dependent Lhr-like helicase
LWQQRKRAADLLHVAARFGSFPIILESFRECLRDVFDMPGRKELLGAIRSREIRVVPVTTLTPSPFAAALLFNYVANFIYEGDALLAERRAQALSVDPSQLRELLGDVELRELIDEEALEQLERYLAHQTPERAVRHTDGVHDLLLRLGDRTLSELMSSVADTRKVRTWVESLLVARRIVMLAIAGEARYIAAEDMGRYRDALGTPAPPGLPNAFLEPKGDPLGDLVARYARTHGPFQATDLAKRYAMGVAPFVSVLERMAGDGKIVLGEFRPGGSGFEWCDAGVLRALRQKSLARLRHEVEPVEKEAMCRLYLDWQGVAAKSCGRARTSEGNRTASRRGNPCVDTRIRRASCTHYRL